jgi:single-stranded DNA-binding protein
LDDLGRDSEARVTASGKNQVNLGLCTTKARKEGTEWVQEAVWHDLYCFGNLADRFAIKPLPKGALVQVQGELTYWESMDGKKKSKRAQINVKRSQSVGLGQTSF